MTDPLPELTNFLQSILLYLIYLGIVLSGISGVIAGILFLPVFGLDNQRAAYGLNALCATGIGLVIIVLALPGRSAILHYFPPPAGVPIAPLPTPLPTPTPGP